MPREEQDDCAEKQHAAHPQHNCLPVPLREVSPSWRVLWTDRRARYKPNYIAGRYRLTCCQSVVEAIWVWLCPSRSRGRGVLRFDRHSFVPLLSIRSRPTCWNPQLKLPMRTMPRNPPTHDLNYRR
jgi:hypothetical protein